MKNILHKLKENRLVCDILWILIVALILSIPLFSKKLDLYYDDGSQHLMRAYGTFESIIKNGSGAVISNFANGFGYSWDLFYGPLSVYILILLGILAGSFNMALKIVMCILFFAAGSMMYKLIYEITEKHNMALLAAIIYITSPYLFTDIYLRHALRRMFFLCVFANGVFGIV